MIRCYNTLTKQYQLVETSEIVETEYKRSYWREEQQGRRYYQRALALNEEIAYRSVYNKRVEDMVIEAEEIELLQKHIIKLSEKERLIIDCIYYQGMTKTATAKVLGVSDVHIGRLDKKIKTKLKESILEDYDYYV